MALGLSRMGWVYSPLATLDGTGATCMEASMDYEEKAQLRFWGRVNKTESCWLWTGSSRVRGYGGFWYHGKTWSSHRLAYIWTKGEIPEGMVLDHTCRVRSCVNPDHLRVVTPKQNTLENSMAVTAINARMTHCFRCESPLVYLKRLKRRGCLPCINAASRRRYALRRDKATTSTGVS